MTTNAVIPDGTDSVGVGEAARRCGISVDALRYYEKEQLLRAGRTANGHRRYSADDIAWIGVLTCLRDTGMPIRRMREFAALVSADETTTYDARALLLETHRADVGRRIDELRANLDRIEHKIAWYRDQLA